MSFSSIFISYSHIDYEMARRIKDDLERYGVNVWLDEIQITVGDNIFERMGEGVEKCDYTAVLLSPDSVGSRYVAYEIEIAMQHEKRIQRNVILPLMVVKCQIPDSLNGRLWVDFSNPSNYLNAFTYLLHRLGYHDKRIIVTSEDELFLASKIPSLDHRQRDESIRDHLIRSSITLAGIKGHAPAWSESKMYLTLYELTKRHLIEVFIDQKTVYAGTHTSISDGAIGLFPYFSKGDFYPEYRPSLERIDLLFRLLRESTSP